MPGTRAAEAVRQDQILDAALAVATRGGLRALTVRRVATRARLSPGLVLFHFRRKDQLVVSLLDRVLARTTALTVGPDIAGLADPLERLVALLRQEMRRIAAESHQIRLFFEFWTAGLRRRDIRSRMKAELDRYRAAFQPMCAAVVADYPERFDGVSVTTLTTVAVGFIKGCAVQSMVEPDLDVDNFAHAAARFFGSRAPMQARAAGRR